MVNNMREIKVAKLTLNIGAGKDSEKLEKGVKLIKIIAGVSPVKTFTNKRIPGWGLRPGLPIGCKLTLRHEAASKMLGRMLQAKDNKLKAAQFDSEGNLSFGIPEYIDIPDVNYDPAIGILGLEVCVTLERPGFRVKKRRIRKATIPAAHRISRQDAILFMKQQFGIEVGENA